MHIPQNALEAVEFADEDVGLVDFVCHHHELLLSGKIDDRLDILLGETCTSWVARVYYDDCSHICALFYSFLVR